MKSAANDFGGMIAEKTFGSGIPTKQLPIKSDQENSVLRCVGRQQVKSLAFFL